MIDHEKMSDDKLSLAILKIKCGGLAEKYSTSPPSTAFALLSSGYGGGSTTSSFDINNWSDMGPLIRENKISIHYRANPKLLPMAKRINSDQHNETHANELRAAAIVYLKMMESEK
jgi:hypothetical protein